MLHALSTCSDHRRPAGPKTNLLRGWNSTKGAQLGRQKNSPCRPPFCTWLMVLRKALRSALLEALRSVLQTAFPAVLLLVPHSVPQKILLLAPRLALHKGSSVGSSVGSRLALQAAALRPATTLTRCGRERWMPGSAGEPLGVGRRLSSSRPRIRCPLRLRSSPGPRAGATVKVYTMGACVT